MIFLCFPSLTICPLLYRIFRAVFFLSGNRRAAILRLALFTLAICFFDSFFFTFFFAFFGSLLSSFLSGFLGGLLGCLLGGLLGRLLGSLLGNSFGSLSCL